MITQISHILCDCLRAVYGERPSTFHKEMIAKSLVKTYPILGSAASDVPHALWFHKNGRGEGRHAGKIHYRMEYFAKKSDNRVIRRRQNPQQSQPDAEPDQAEPLETVEDFECLVNELKFSVPSEQTKTHIKNLWKRTIRFRNDHRDAGSFLTFLTDFPVASAFGGLLIMSDYEALHPKAPDFRAAWNELQEKILERYRDKYRFLKNDFIRALAIVREKNPTRGSKRPRERNEQDLRKNNPLHGIILWINADAPIPEPDVPQIVIRGEEFVEGNGSLVWKNVAIPLETDILSAFALLCATFTVFNVKCSPSDKLFYGFFQRNVLQSRCFKHHW
nr:uncharacterized protein LOC109397381 isoform X1 [Aedes albopictus]